METVKTKSVIGADRRLRIDMEVPLPPGPVEVVVVVSPEAGPLPAGIDPEAVRQRFLAAAFKDCLSRVVTGTAWLLHTSAYVIDETVTFLCYHTNHATACAALGSFRDLATDVLYVFCFVPGA